VAVFFPSAVCIRAGMCGRVRLCVSLCIFVCGLCLCRRWCRRLAMCLCIQKRMAISMTSVYIDDIDIYLMYVWLDLLMYVNLHRSS
jgi:hypothetical protein